MVALSPLWNVVRSARGDSCSESGIVASACGCGDDSLKPAGDENGSSFVIDFDLRWYPGVVVSDFTIVFRSVSTFPGVRVRRVRGLFSNNSRSSWVAVDLRRPSSGETPPALVLRGDKIGPSSPGDREDQTALREVVIGVEVFSPLEELPGVGNSFVERSCEERGG